MTALLYVQKQKKLEVLETLLAVKTYTVLLITNTFKIVEPRHNQQRGELQQDFFDCVLLKVLVGLMEVSISWNETKYFVSEAIQKKFL